MIIFIVQKEFQINFEEETPLKSLRWLITKMANQESMGHVIQCGTWY